MLGRALASGVFAGALLATFPVDDQAKSSQPGVPTTILGVVGRQVAWLNLEVPRHRPVSELPLGSNALELAAQPDGSHVVVAVDAPFDGSGPHGADLLSLDLQSGVTSSLLRRVDARESLDSPAWWADQATLVFERQDLSGRPVGAPGQEVPRYPSRIERVKADGRNRSTVLDEGRLPSGAPDGTRLVFARTRNQGAALLIWSELDGSVQTLIPEGRFADVAYLRFSPGSDQIAFVAPQSGVNDRLEEPRLSQELLFGPAVAFAHGIPWDAWVVNADGSGLHRVAEMGADEPSVTWSPDQRQLFVFSGTGSFIADAATGELWNYSCQRSAPGDLPLYLAPPAPHG